MPHIYQLDRHVADLIAAGEVVERPASAVKELVENAIDAGARTITVELQNGGMTLLRVTDDGCGMSPEDAKTAFLRHATSKIRTKEDLSAIQTLGFRGEALAAISSVSRIDLLTRAEECEGVRLHLEAGIVQSEQPAGCPQGTTIVVRDLFFNTPARMKFMKSDVAEASAIAGVVQQQALAHPEISFRLIRDGEEQLHTPGDSERMSAIYAVFGRELAGNLLPVDGHWEKIAVRGYVSKPTATRGNRSWQVFFVNGRYVRSKLLGAALEEAYRNQMMVGRFPACVLEVVLPVQAVDVNVHPAKTEVKFLSERAVFDAVHYAVLSALGKNSAKPEMKLQEPKQTASAAAPVKPDFYKTMQTEEYRRLASAREEPKRPVYAAPEAAMPQLSVASEIQLPVSDKKPTPPPEPKPKPVSVPQVEAPVPEQPEQQSLPMEQLQYRVIGETMNTYILVEQGDSLLLIDKHAAHERINFEKLRKSQGAIVSQLLLAPLPAELSREEAGAVLENRAVLEACGFEVDDFGGGDLVIRQIPADVREDDARALLQALAADLLTGKRLDPASLRDRLLHTVACKAAIKAGWHTAQEEREYLVKEVLSRDDIRCCPHGRPVCIQLTKKQLEKQFKRS